MNFSVAIDWKLVAAIGATAVGIIFAVKMESAVVERVSTHIADACKEYAVAVNGNY